MGQSSVFLEFTSFLADPSVSVDGRLGMLQGSVVKHKGYVMLRFLQPSRNMTVVFLKAGAMLGLAFT